MRIDVESGRDFRDHGNFKGAPARHGLQRNVGLRLDERSRPRKGRILARTQCGDQGNKRKECEAARISRPRLPREAIAFACRPESALGRSS